MNIRNQIIYPAQDTMAMFKRCLLLSLRNLDSLLTGVGTPVLMMLLFVYVLGGAMRVGNIHYVDYLVPGIILQCIGQCGTTTAISVNNDLKSGIINRFRSMPIASSSVLTGHALAALIRNIITAVLILLMAYLIGFRPSAGIAQWLLVMGFMLLFMSAITWISIIIGLISNSTESTTGISAIIMFLPYLSSGFVPTETMPQVLKIFAEHQPMTPLIESMRSLLLDSALNEYFVPAILWWTGISVIAYASAIILYRRKIQIR